MKLVIDIQEEDYRKVQDGRASVSMMRKAIINGTPLPKGHGRLIDADELKKHKYHDNDKCENAVSIAQVDWEPTIIEADKGESEE